MITRRQLQKIRKTVELSRCNASGSYTPCEARLRRATRSVGLTHLSCDPLFNVALFLEKILQTLPVLSTLALRMTSCKACSNFVVSRRCEDERCLMLVHLSSLVFFFFFWN